MLNNIKLVMLVLVLLVGFTACSAEPPKEVINEQPADTNQSVEITENGKYMPGEWITDYTQALAFAKEAKLPVLINFTGSDWCIWCKRLSKEVFTEQAFIDYAKENLILLKLDFPKSLPQTAEEKQMNESLARQYKIEGFPTIIMLNSEGEEMNRTGYQQGGAENYVEHLKSLIK